MENIEKRVSDWKAKYGNIFLVEIEGEKAYLRKPTRKDIAYASAGSNGDPFKLNEILIEQCWLDGDSTIKDNVEYYMALANKFGELLKIKEATLKEL